MDNLKLERLIYTEDCQIASICCQNALKILEEVDIEEKQKDLDSWLDEYYYLYLLLTNQPRNLPPILRTTCDVFRYPSLKEFWERYHYLRFPKEYDQESNAERS